MSPLRANVWSFSAASLAPEKMRLVQSFLSSNKCSAKIAPGPMGRPGVPTNTASSEEEPHADLHLTKSSLAVNASEHRRIGIGDDLSVHRMIKDVERFNTRLKIARLVIAEIELFQNAGVGCEFARVAQIGKEHRRVGQRKVRRALEGAGIQYPRSGHACPVSIDDQRVFVLDVRIPDVV